jgi:hypothetical protein
VCTHSKNAFNLTCDNSEILITWLLRREFPRPEGLLFYQEKDSSLKEADLWNVFKMAYKSVCTSVITVSPDPLFPTPSTSLAM